MNNRMVLEYLQEKFNDPEEPILLSNIHIDNMSASSLRYHMKRLVDKGVLRRFKRGVYYFPSYLYGRETSFNYDHYIHKKYLYQNGKQIGYFSNFTLSNMLHLTNQVPFIREIITNNTSALKKLVKLDYHKFILRKSNIKITSENVYTLMLLDALKNIDRTGEFEADETSEMLIYFIDKAGIKKEMIMKYINYYPPKTYKALVSLGVLKYVSAS